MLLGQLALGMILGAFIFVPLGYIVRVWLSRATESDTRSPCVDEIYNALDRLQHQQDAWGTSLGAYKQDLQLMESKLTLMSNEQADFFDKTRKSEERQRGLMRRTEAAVGDDEDTAEADQVLLGLMEGQEEQGAPLDQTQFASPEAYYAAQRARS